MNEAITVRELIERLQQADPDALVVLSRDPEGNEYAPCHEMRWGYVYVAYPDSPSGEVYDADPDVHQGQVARPAVVLWP